MERLPDKKKITHAIAHLFLEVMNSSSNINARDFLNLLYDNDDQSLFFGSNERDGVAIPHYKDPDNASYWIVNEAALEWEQQEGGLMIAVNDFNDYIEQGLRGNNFDMPSVHTSKMKKYLLTDPVDVSGTYLTGGEQYDRQNSSVILDLYSPGNPVAVIEAHSPSGVEHGQNARFTQVILGFFDDKTSRDAFIQRQKRLIALDVAKEIGFSTGKLQKLRLDNSLHDDTLNQIVNLDNHNLPELLSHFILNGYSSDNLKGRIDKLVWSGGKSDDIAVVITIDHDEFVGKFNGASITITEPDLQWAIQPQIALYLLHEVGLKGRLSGQLIIEKSPKNVLIGP